MREQCIARVERVLGRSITQAEARNIDKRIQETMVRLARKDPSEWRQQSASERLERTAKAVGDDLVAAIELKKRRMADTIQRTAELQNYLTSQVVRGADQSHSRALLRLLRPEYDGQSHRVSLEAKANGYLSDAVGRLSDATDKVTPGLLKSVVLKVTGDRRLERALVDALHGAPNEDITPDVAAAAKAYQAEMEGLRQQMNGAGGEVGQLKDYMPHSWSGRLALKAGREAFVGQFMGWVDRKVYVHPDGRAYTDAEMREFLSKSWESIALDGGLKQREPVMGGQMKALRHSAHRQLHLKPEAAWQALSAYSEKNPLEAMFDKVRAMARDIALVETFGPNPDNVFATLTNYAETADLRAGLEDIDGQTDGASRERRKLLVDAEERHRQHAQRLFDHLAGNDPPPANAGLARGFAAARSLEVASKLGGTVLSSFGDLVTLHSAALQNGLNPLKVALNSNLTWLKRSRKYMRRLGVMTDAVLGHAHRYAGEVNAQGLSAKAASFVLQASGMNFVTDARRIGFMVTMMDAIGSMTRRAAKISDLSAKDQLFLERLSVTQADWDIWRRAKLEQWGVNGKLLTADSIRAIPDLGDTEKRQALARLLGILHAEQDIAVLTPSASERVALAPGRKGTWGGEIVNSVFLFKAFPWTYLQRIVLQRSRYAGDSLLNRAMYVAGIALGMTAIQVVVGWTRDLLSGKDPRSIDVFSEDPRKSAIGRGNIAKALLASGGLGVYGDFLFQQTRDGPDATALETAAGPLIGTGVDALNLVQGNLVQKTVNPDKDSNFASEAIGFTRANFPGANLWYTKAVMDRFVWNKLIEEVDPGYFDKAERRQRSTFGTTYWWEPDEEAPERAPNLEAAVGQ